MKRQINRTLGLILNNMYLGTASYRSYMFSVNIYRYNKTDQKMPIFEMPVLAVT